MTTSVSEIVVQNQPVVHDVEALVQAAVSVLTNDMAIATHDQLPSSSAAGNVQLLVDTSSSIQERLYMCTDCNLAFYGAQGEQEWQWHLKQHKPFKCDLCSEAYEDKESLKTHVRSHSIQMPFVCDKCGSAYSLKSNLTQHMKTHEDSLYRCAECDIYFKTQANLMKHLKMHSGDTINLFQCDTCNKQFTQQKNLVQHMKIHQGTVGKQYKCPECPAAYSYKCHLSRHLIIHTGEKPYKCKFCGKAFNRNAHLIRHRKMHSGAEKEWKCQQCGFAFWEKGDLVRHMKSHEGNRPLKCDFCEQTFVWKRYLYKHLINHHKEEGKHFCRTCCACLGSEEELIQHEVVEHSNKRQLTHTCVICNEEFHFKYKLDEHMYQHTGEMAHACEKCPLKFISRRELDRHVAEHQQEVSFRCNTCEKTFSNIEELQVHVKLHTGNAKYICSVCRATFRWRSQLTSHMVVHSNDQDFKCGLCIKKFKRKRDLSRHVKIFHDTRPPYTCVECRKDFHSPVNLMQHKIETHWRNQDIEPGKFACKHCTGMFGIKPDLDRHLSKVHPPRPFICIPCSKRFIKIKFLEKHFEVKHEGEKMEEGRNYEVKNLNKTETIAKNEIVTEDGNMSVEVETVNLDENEGNMVQESNELEQNALVIQGVEMLPAHEFTANNVEQEKSTPEITIPIPEAITLAEFAQQGTGDSVIPVFLQHDISKLHQDTHAVETQRAHILATKAVTSSPQVITAGSSTVAASKSSVIPQIVKIPRPQVVQIGQSVVPLSNTGQSETVVASSAEVSKPVLTTAVKIPILNKGTNQGTHVIVQKLSGPRKGITIIPIPSGQAAAGMGTQAVPVKLTGNIPNWELTSASDLAVAQISQLEDNGKAESTKVENIIPL